MEILKKPGIYLIFNLANQRVYIGQSKNVKTRLAIHKSSLRHSNHSNDYLQNAFNKYGEDKFVFRSVEYCEVENLTEREEYWIGQFNSINPNRGYNLMRARTHGGHSEETREKIGAAHKGKIISEEHRAKISENNKYRSEETRANFAAANKSKVLSEETRAKISAARKGKTPSEESRAKMCIAQKGRVVSEEARAKISAANKLRWENKRKTE